MSLCVSPNSLVLSYCIFCGTHQNDKLSTWFKVDFMSLLLLIPDHLIYCLSFLKSITCHFKGVLKTLIWRLTLIAQLIDCKIHHQSQVIQTLHCSSHCCIICWTKKLNEVGLLRWTRQVPSSTQFRFLITPTIVIIKHVSLPENFIQWITKLATSTIISKMTVLACFIEMSFFSATYVSALQLPSKVQNPFLGLVKHAWMTCHNPLLKVKPVREVNYNDKDAFKLMIGLSRKEKTLAASLW